MKKNIFILFSACILLSACKTDFTELYYKGDAFVSFPKDQEALFEALGGNAKSRKITVNRSTGDIAAPATISFSATSKYTSGTNTGASAEGTYTILGDGGTSNSLVIPAGKSSAEITITSVDNALLDGYKEVQITLSEANGLKVGYPGPSQTGKSITVTIFDDEDPTFNLAKFLGDYACTEPNFGTYDVVFTKSSLAPNSIVNSNFWGEGIAVIYVLDPLTNKVTIPQQEFPTSNDPATGQARVYVISGQATLGTLNPVTGGMIVPYLVRRRNVVTSAISTLDINTHTFTRK